MAIQTVSAQVRELERDLGCQLLKPAGRGPALTEAGVVALQQAEHIFQLGEALPELVRGAAQVQAGAPDGGDCRRPAQAGGAAPAAAGAGCRPACGWCVTRARWRTCWPTWRCTGWTWCCPTTRRPSTRT